MVAHVVCLYARSFFQKSSRSRAYNNADLRRRGNFSQKGQRLGQLSLNAPDLRLLLILLVRHHYHSSLLYIPAQHHCVVANLALGEFDDLVAFFDLDPAV